MPWLFCDRKSRTCAEEGPAQGSAWLRWILIEAAQHAVRRPSRYQELYRRLVQRKGPKVARVAVARELLTTAYWIMRHAEGVIARDSPN